MASSEEGAEAAALAERLRSRRRSSWAQAAACTCPPRHSRRRGSWVELLSEAHSEMLGRSPPLHGSMQSVAWQSVPLDELVRQEAGVERHRRREKESGEREERRRRVMLARRDEAAGGRGGEAAHRAARAACIAP